MKVFLFEAIVLGIVQGLTEFLPVSSTAHLSIVPALLHWPDPGAAFSAVIQCGTLVAVLAYFRRELIRISQAWFRELRSRTYWESLDARMGWMIILGTLPVVVFGLLLKHQIEGNFRNLYVVAAAQIVFAFLLLAAEVQVRREKDAHVARRGLDQLGWMDSLAVGFFQTLALIPGASRSGVTIAGGLFRGMRRDTAARFSFLLSIPAVFAAAMLELFHNRAELLASNDHIVNLVVCTLVSGIVGYAAIAFLLRFLKTHSTYVFIGYRLVLGVAIVVLISRGFLDPHAGMEKDETAVAPSAYNDHALVVSANR